VLEEARSTYDLVVIDTPPLAAVSDAFPLLRTVDGVIIVGRGGRNRRDVAERLHETLTGAHAPLLGVVANGFKVSRLHSYDYAYDSARAAARPTPSLETSDNGASSSEEPLSATDVPGPASAEAVQSRDGGSADGAVEPSTRLSPGA
jgi:Mrp family chromosome partitioning ATPase